MFHTYYNPHSALRHIATMARARFRSKLWNAWSLPFLLTGALTIGILQIVSVHVHQHRLFGPMMATIDGFLQPSTIITGEPHYYMVFSTSCSDLQHWQSMVFFYHAYKVGQPGNVTRIVSGCSDKQRQQLIDFHRRYIEPMSEHFGLHLTPDFSRVVLARGQPFKYMNKPYGLGHWMEHALGLKVNKTAPSLLSQDIVMLLDPDMILLQPLRHNFTSETVLWVDQEPATRVVRPGYPVAQQDGYLMSDWRNLNWTYITSTDNHVPPPSTPQEGVRQWNAGPPYLATVGDFWELTQKWMAYTPRIVELKSHMFGEMWGLIIAAVQLRMPFTFIPSLVVSNAEAVDREGWPYIDVLPDEDLCQPPASISSPLPIGLHYCQRYFLSDAFFSKYRVKKKIMECDRPLLLPPSATDLHLRQQYGVTPPRADLSDKDTWKPIKEPFDATRAKREMFMLCQMIAAMNEALRHHKSLACTPSQANLNASWTVYNDPRD